MKCRSITILFIVIAGILSCSGSAPDNTSAKKAVQALLYMQDTPIYLVEWRGLNQKSSSSQTYLGETTILYDTVETRAIFYFSQVVDRGWAIVSVDFPEAKGMRLKGAELFPLSKADSIIAADANAFSEYLKQDVTTMSEELSREKSEALVSREQRLQGILDSLQNSLTPTLTVEEYNNLFSPWYNSFVKSIDLDVNSFWYKKDEFETTKDYHDSLDSHYEQWKKEFKVAIRKYGCSYEVLPYMPSYDRGSAIEKFFKSRLNNYSNINVKWLAIKANLSNPQYDIDQKVMRFKVESNGAAMRYTNVGEYSKMPVETAKKIKSDSTLEMVHYVYLCPPHFVLQDCYREGSNSSLDKRFHSLNSILYSLCNEKFLGKYHTERRCPNAKEILDGFYDYTHGSPQAVNIYNNKYGGGCLN